MLIPFDQIDVYISKKVHGVLHVGAHMCEELDMYKRNLTNNIVWIEADPSVSQSARSKHPEEVILTHLVTDKDNETHTFNIANNNESSSIYDFGTHAIYHDTVKFVKSKLLKSSRIDTLYRDYGFREDFANFVNLDIQGAELLALKGMGNLLSNFDYVYVEVNTEEVYKDCPLLQEVTDFLGANGFERKLLAMTRCKWGDAFFVHKSVK